MTKRERVIAALSHKETDIIPYQVDFTQQQRQKMVEYLNDSEFENKIGNHIEGVYYDGWPKEEVPGYYVDDFGVRWNRTGVDKDIGVVDRYILSQPSLKEYKFPEPDEKALREQFEAMLNRDNQKFKVGNLGFSMFERAWTLRGMENLLADMVLEPVFVEELLDAICEFNLKIIDIGLSYDIDAFQFGDDWGQQRGLIMGPKFWRKFIKPRMARMYERVKSKGKFVIQHSCGDIHEIFPDLIDIGLDVYQTFQPEIYHIDFIKKEYGKHLSFWGGISTQRLLPFGTIDEVKEKTAEIMRIMGKGGGYIAAPTHAVPGDVPPENVMAMLAVMMNQERYL
ncbi:MAG: uroporphyrinogen decarboxylase [Clostridiales bacterium]|nr:uroporphyrinogen decarboxylase [Clostridiales bacterium]